MNNQIFLFFYNLAHQSKIFDSLIIFFAVYFPYIVVILIGLFLLFHHEVLKAEEPFQVLMEKKKEIFFIVFSGVSAWVVAVILKNLFHVSRPFLTLPDIHPLFMKTTFSFPSEHAMFFSALAFSIFFLHKKAGYIFMFFVLIIGLSRIVSGVHFPADIFGGFILGFLLVYFINFFRNSK
ncbi:MAG: phosphatase PAP2 family protein [Candidatus Paceibacterota bacterium]